VIRTLIVDDEPLARTGLRVWLAKEPDVTVVGEAGDGPAAVEAIRALTPDLVLLDVQMPGMDAFDVIDQVAGAHLPLVVFVTAHDEHAIQAFEVHALDYLLKPVSEARFAAAMQRARVALAAGAQAAEDAASDRIARALDWRDTRRNDSTGGGGETAAGPARTPPGRPPVLHRFVVKDRDRYLLVRANDVEWIEAAGNYAQIHTRGAAYLVRATIAELTARLDPNRFARIHRSAIVQIDCIREIVPEWHGDCQVILTSGTTVRMSRGFRERLLPSEARRDSPAD
jgi:two-component system LytT family response regulator